jgi:hypothetical protein
MTLSQFREAHRKYDAGILSVSRQRELVEKWSNSYDTWITDFAPLDRAILSI